MFQLGEQLIGNKKTAIYDAKLNKINAFCIIKRVTNDINLKQNIQNKFDLLTQKLYDLMKDVGICSRHRGYFRTLNKEGKQRLIRELLLLIPSTYRVILSIPSTDPYIKFEEHRASFIKDEVNFYKRLNE